MSLSLSFSSRERGIRGYFPGFWNPQAGTHNHLLLGTQERYTVCQSFKDGEPTSFKG